MHTADSFADVIRRLRYGASHLSIGNFEELQLVHGVHYVPEGILFADDLAVTPLNCMNDWVHTYLHGGVIYVEFGLLMKSMAQNRAPVTYAALGEYVRLWQWPKSIKCNGPGFAQLFTKDAAKKHLDAKHFNCSASELLSLLPVLELYFRRVGLKYGILTENINSLLLSFKVVALLQHTRSRTSQVSAAQLEDAIIAHLTAFYSVYGHDEGRPKHHVAIHLAKQYLQWQRLIPCWVHERYHKLAKAYAITRRNTTAYELGITEDIMVTTLMAMEKTKVMQGGLVDPVPLKGPAFQRLVGAGVEKEGCKALSSRIYSTSLTKIYVGDVALWKEGTQLAIGQVHLHYSLDGNVASIVSPFLLRHREATLLRCDAETSKKQNLGAAKFVQSACFFLQDC